MRAIDQEMGSLVVPKASAAEEAGYLLERLPALWREADLDERRRLLLNMLEAVYVDTQEEKRVVAIKPKAPFRPVFLVATTREGSELTLVKDLSPALPPEANPSIPCLWWRRGGGELHLKRKRQALVAA